MKKIDVVAAVIINDGQVLCAQRGYGELKGKWEFPGGKIKQDENHKQALRREIKEELSCDVEVGSRVTNTVHQYRFGIVHLTTYYCQLIGGKPKSIEHIDIKWMSPSNLLALDWAPADLPAVAIVMKEC